MRRAAMAAGRWVHEHRGSIAVLLYHRVADTQHDPQQLAVGIDEFDAQMQVVREECTPVALRDVPSLLRAARLPRRPVVVTFDDGYRDNLHAAKPILERHGVPATVFVATGYVGARREFWWDELDRLLLGQNGAGTAAYAEWHARLRPAGAEEREQALRELRAAAGEPPEGLPRTDMLAVDENELVALDGGAVEIGSHTRHHLSLAAQPASVQEDEIRSGKADLEAWLGRPVPLFSYPFGVPGTDVSSETTRAARAAGNALAVVNEPRLCTLTASRFALPRYLVRNWSAGEFERWMHTEVLPA